MTGELGPTPLPVRAAPWRRRAGRVAIVLGVALSVVALLCCAGVVYVLYDANRAPREQREMEAFATDICRDLLAGDTNAIYAALSAGARERYSAQEMADGLAARGRMTRCDVVRATYLFLLLTYVVIEDTHGQHTFDLVREADHWKVDSDILNDLDSPPSHGGGGGGGD
jgi:hypothetical protein